MLFNIKIKQYIVGQINRLLFFINMKEMLWSDYIDDTVIINLENRKDRRDLLDPRLEYVNVGDGKTLKDVSRYFKAIGVSELTKQPKGIVEREYEFDYHYDIDSHEKLQENYGKGITLEITDSEMAIALSHYNVWKNIVDNKIQTTLIIEDDVNFNPELSQKLLWAMETELPKNYDMLYLSYIFSHSPTVKEHSENLLKVEKGLWWLSGYILTYEGAKKLLDSLPIKGAVDVWVNHQFSKMEVYLLKHYFIYQTHETKSSNEWSYHNKFYKGTIY